MRDLDNWLEETCIFSVLGGVLGFIFSYVVGFLAMAMDWR